MENSKYNTRNLRKQKWNLGKECPVILIPAERKALGQLLAGGGNVDEMKVNKGIYF